MVHSEWYQKEQALAPHIYELLLSKVLNQTYQRVVHAGTASTQTCILFATSVENLY